MKLTILINADKSEIDSLPNFQEISTKLKTFKWIDNKTTYSFDIDFGTMRVLKKATHFA